MFSKAKTLFADRESRCFILALLAVVISRLVMHHFRPLADDAYITFRYASNLAEGRGFVFHEGERLLATTTPLFGLFCAGLYKLGLDLVAVVPLISCMFDMAIFWLLWRFYLQGQPLLIKISMAFFFIASPIVLDVSSSGMEASAFTLVLLSSLLLVAKERYKAVAVLAGASIFVRPEGVMLLGLIGAYLLFKKRYAKALHFSLLAACVIVPSVAAIYNYYGSVLPHSMLVKASVPEVLEGQKPSAFYLFLMQPRVLPITLFALLGCFAVFRSKHVPLQLLSVFGGGYLLAYVVANPFVFPWYIFPYAVICCVWAAFGIKWLLLKTKTASAFSYALPSLVLISLCIACLYAARDPLFRVADDGRWAARQLDEEIRQFCEQSKPISVHTMCDLGRLGYYCPSTHFYDSCGLASKESLELQRDRKKFPQFVEQHQPQYIAYFIYDDITPENDDVVAETLNNDYQLQKVLTPPNAPASSPYRQWNVLLYQRR